VTSSKPYDTEPRL
jgi:hypothetical protein